MRYALVDKNKKRYQGVWGTDLQPLSATWRGHEDVIGVHGPKNERGAVPLLPAEAAADGAVRVASLQAPHANARQVLRAAFHFHLCTRKWTWVSGNSVSTGYILRYYKKQWLPIISSDLDFSVMCGCGNYLNIILLSDERKHFEENACFLRPESSLWSAWCSMAEFP